VIDNWQEYQKASLKGYIYIYIYKWHTSAVSQNGQEKY